MQGRMLAFISLAGFLTLSGLAFENYVKAWGGADSAPPMKNTCRVSEPNSFLHSHLYTYRQPKSRRTSL